MKTTPLPRAPRACFLLGLSRRCYFLFLRLNGWRSQLLPSPLRGGGLILKWSKTVGSVRRMETTEDALAYESNLRLAHRARQAFSRP